MRYFISSFLYFVFNCLILSNITLAQSRSGSSIEDFTITITFVQNPVNGPIVTKAPLKYNKDFALILQMDNGNPAIHDQVMPYFKGQNGNPGLFFTEGPNGSNQPFKMDATYFTFDAAGQDVHNYVNGYLHWDNIINLWAGEFGLITNGLNQPSTSDAALEVQRSASYTKRKTFSGTIPDGAEMFVYTLPSDGASQLTEAKAHHLAVYHGGSSALDNPAKAETLPAINGLELKREAITSNLFNRVQTIANQCNATNHYIASFHIPGFGNGEITFDQFKQQMNLIGTAFGREGTNKIWSGSSTEVFEYLRIKELVTVNTSQIGNVLTITFTDNGIPDNFRFYALSVVVQGESNIVDMVVQQPDGLSTYMYSNASALLNLKWDGYVPQDDLQRATDQVVVAEADITAANALVAMDYVLMLPDGEPKESLRTRLCSLGGIDYEEGFCPLADFLGPDTTLCLGDTLRLALPESASYLWSTGETTPNILFEALESAKIWGQVTSQGGSTAADTIQITVLPLPVVTIVPDTVTINPKDEVLLTAAGADSFLWSTGSTNATLLISPVFTTDYTVIGSTVAGCKDTATSHVIVEYLTNLQFSFDTVCLGDTTHLIAQVTTNDSILVLEWDTNGDGLFNDGTGDSLNIVFTSAAEHLVGLRAKTESGGMHIIYNKIIVADYPQTAFLVDHTCEGETVQFTDQTGLQMGTINSWNWEFGTGSGSTDRNPLYFYDATGSYDVTLVAVSNFGCSDTLTKNITIYPIPAIDLRLSDGSPVAADQSIELPESGSLSFSVLSPYDSIEWSGGVKTDNFTVSTTGYYSAVVYQNGCYNSRFFTVTNNVGPTNPVVGIMNLLTPNADGFNDVWLIQGIDGINPATVVVYARSGKTVFESSAYDNTWNGYYNGNPLPEGSYFYIVKGADGSVYKGTLSILR
ncbi:MAG: gliding motility-associated C-terminal domain-containing protein [Bacteroidales bacterium]